MWWFVSSCNYNSNFPGLLTSTGNESIFVSYFWQLQGEFKNIKSFYDNYNVICILFDSTILRMFLERPWKYNEKKLVLHQWQCRSFEIFHLTWIFWIFDSILLMSWYLNKIHLLRDCCAVLGNISSESPLPHSTVQHLPVSSVLLFQINQDIDWFVDTHGHCTPLGLQRKYKLVLLTRVLPDCLG